MDTTIANKIGRIQTFKAALIGLIIAYLIMAYLSFNSNFPSALLFALSWFIDANYKINLLIGIISVLICANLFGRRAGIDIIINNKNKYWTGIKYALLIVWVGTFFGSIITFSENIGVDKDVFFDYIGKPIILVTLFGFIPIIILGLWLGYSISHKAR